MTMHRRGLGTIAAIAHLAPSTPPALGMAALYTPGEASATLEKMARFVENGLNDPYVIDRANAIIAQVAPRDWVGQVNAIRAFLLRTVHFVDNPVGKQRIQPVAAMLHAIDAQGFVMGACDDAADLAAAIGMANGLPARFVAIAFPQAGVADPPYTHVLTELLNGTSWVPLDVTRPESMLRMPPVARTLTLDLETMELQ